MKHLLPRLSVSRPVSVIMILVALLVVGSIACLRTPVNLLPEGLESPELGIWVAYPNATPVEVEQKIARKIEESVATVSRVERISSNSSQDGCWVDVRFAPNTDIRVAYAELRDRMERVMPEMPDEVDRIEVQHWDENDIPIIWMVATVDEALGDPILLLEIHLRPRLQRIPGVGNVDVWGGYDRQVLIEVDQDKARSIRVAYAELRDRMERVMPEMPDEVDRIEVQHWDENDIPIIWMVATVDEALGDPILLLEIHLRPRLQRIPGVGNVDVWGGYDRQVLIEVDQDKARSHNVNLYEVVNRLGNQNFALPGGSVFDGGKKIYVRSLGRFETAQELRDLRIGPGSLKLSDIARIGLVRPPRQWVQRVNGEEALGIAIQRASGGNIAQITADVRQALAELRLKPLFRNVKFEIMFDQGKFVGEAIDNLKTSGLWGGMFAAIVLFLFLRAVRMTLIITAAIPLSILSTITALYFMGWSLNIGTMMGLMLSLGLVVDNAIVIVENVQRKRQEGVEPRQASDRRRGSRPGRHHGDPDDGGRFSAPDSHE